MSAAVLIRQAPAAVVVCGVCHGTGGIFRGGRFPEACPNGCPPRIVRAGGCLECGCSPSTCGSAAGCGCTCCCSYLPASAP